MTVDEIRELINLAAETGIAELEVQRGDNRVRIRRAFAAPQEIVVSPTAYAPQTVHAPAPLPRPCRPRLSTRPPPESAPRKASRPTPAWCW